MILVLQLFPVSITYVIFLLCSLLLNALCNLDTYITVGEK